MLALNRWAAFDPLQTSAVEIFCVARCLLLDHLVGGRQQCFRDGEAERLGGLQVDDKFEFRRLLDR